MKPHSYIITGPTASGKSDFAHALARRIGESRPSGGTAPLSRRGGVIINCDSVQAYRGIENLSASPLANCPPSWGGLSPQATGGGSGRNDKVSPPSAVAASGAEPLPPTGAPARLVVSRGVDMRGENLDHPNFEIDSVPYKLFSITTGDKPLSAGIWAQMARAEYDAAIASGRAPIFVGGAGFYLRALTDGMSPMPAVPTAARAAAREFAGVDLAGAYEYLKTIDAPWAAAINKNDTQRIVRGIEVFRSTGRPLSEWQNAPRIPMLPAPPLKILIMPDRGLLRERISARMPDLAQSVLTEVGDILESGFDKSLPIWKADGILEISRYLRGEIDFDAAVDLWRAKICNHNMKHQYTWFKTNFAPDIVIDHIPTEKDLDLILQGPRRT